MKKDAPSDPHHVANRFTFPTVGQTAQMSNGKTTLREDK